MTQIDLSRLLDYSYWMESMAGKKPKAFVDQCELGFYRKSISERNAQGNSRRVGWEAVAVFMDGDVMVARVGAKEITDADKLNELWSWIATNPISEEWYRAVAEHGKPWPDAHDPSKNKVEIEPTFKPGDISGIIGERERKLLSEQTIPPKYGLSPAMSAIGTEESPESKLAREIAQAKAGVSQYDKIESDEMAGRALSLKNTITSLAGDLDKHRENLVRPHIDAQREVNDRLNPIIKAAKADAASLLRAIGVFEDWKREQARKAQAKADKEAAEHAAKVKAAEDAGKPAPAPPPAPVVSNAPPPSTQVAAAVGRKASVKVAKFVTDIDVDLAFQHFKGEWAVKNFLLELTQKAVNAGIDVPGATVEERSVVR